MNDAELVRGIEALVVEATRDTPRLTPEQVAARAATERRQAMEALYRQSPGLYEAVTDIARRVQRRREHRQFLRRILGGSGHSALVNESAGRTAAPTSRRAIAG